MSGRQCPLNMHTPSLLDRDRPWWAHAIYDGVYWHTMRTLSDTSLHVIIPVGTLPSHDGDVSHILIPLRASPCHLFSHNMSECTNGIYNTTLLLSGFVKPNFAGKHLTLIICTSDYYFFRKSYNCDIRSILKYKIWQTQELPNGSNLNHQNYTSVLTTYWFSVTYTNITYQPPNFDASWEYSQTKCVY
jgi:hypothetical protein